MENCKAEAGGAEPSICQGCGLVITEPYFYNVHSQNTSEAWHERCLKCSMCGLSMSKKCFIRNGRLYCQRDYQRLFFEKCSGCGEIIQHMDCVIKTVKGPYFHTNCFNCSVCGRRLQTGDLFDLRENDSHCWVYCSLHMSNQPNTHGGLALSAEDYMRPLPHWSDDDIERGLVSGRIEKRPRTVLSASQRRILKNSFDNDPKPSKKARHLMAMETGLSIRVVQVWFQNQRAKVKKRVATSSNEDEKTTSSPTQSPISPPHRKKTTSTHETTTQDDTESVLSDPVNSPYSENDTFSQLISTTSEQSFNSSNKSLTSPQITSHYQPLQPTFTQYCY